MENRKSGISLAETKGLLSRTVYVLQPEQRLRERFSAHSLRHGRVRRPGAITTFRSKFFASPTRGTTQLRVFLHASDPLLVPERWAEQRDPSRAAPSSVKIINGVSPRLHFQKSCDDNSLFLMGLPLDPIISSSCNRKFSSLPIYISLFGF